MSAPVQPAAATPRGIDRDKLQWAKVSTIAGGVLMLAGALLVFVIFSLIFGLSVGFAPPEIGAIAAIAFVFFLFAVLASLVLGCVAIYGAMQFEKENGRTWALVVLICGAVAFFTGAGFFLGAVLLVVGGALAYSGLPAQSGERSPLD